MEFILRAFANGMDGVFVGGCRLGECNYTTHGNHHALNMVLLCRRLLEHVGLAPDRLSIEFMSSGEGNLFAEVVDRFIGRVRKLGPLGSGGEAGRDEIKSHLRELERLVPYIKMVMREKLATRLEEGEQESFYTREEIAALLREVASYHIDPAKCQACGICLRRCPVEAIDGAKNRIHVVDQDKCIKCGTCLGVCPARFAAVRKTSGQPVPPPPAEQDRIIARPAPRE